MCSVLIKNGRPEISLGDQLKILGFEETSMGSRYFATFYRSQHKQSPMGAILVHINNRNTMDISVSFNYRGMNEVHPPILDGLKDISQIREYIKKYIWPKWFTELNW